MSSASTTPEPTGIHDLPPEILASAFETIIYTSSADISLILPLTLVCRTWYDLITSTPRLWGILNLHRNTNPRALAQRIAHAKASPLSITADTTTRVRDRQMVKQFKALTGLVENWVALDVGVEFLVAVCELDRNRDRERERDLKSPVPLGCEPVLGWVDMYRFLHSLTLARGQWDHETPGAFFTHGGGVPAAAVADVKLHAFTSISLPLPWILGFLGPNIKNLRLLRGDRGLYPWAFSNTHSHHRPHFITIDGLLDILSRIPNATFIELERTVRSASPTPTHSFTSQKVVHLPFLRELTLRGLLYTALILASIRVPTLQTLSVDRTDRTWDEPLAPVFAQWSQCGFVMENLHTLELINCLKDDDIPYLIRWLRRTKSLVRLYIVQELQSPQGLSEEDDEDEETHLFKALASPRISGDIAEWLCQSLMILRIDLPDTPIRTLISIARVRGGVVPYPYPSLPSAVLNAVNPTPPPPPARLRSIETRLCAAGEQADIDLLKSLVENPQCICMNCALHLPLDRLALTTLEV